MPYQTPAHISVLSGVLHSPQWVRGGVISNTSRIQPALHIDTVRVTAARVFAPVLGDWVLKTTKANEYATPIYEQPMLLLQFL